MKPYYIKIITDDRCGRYLKGIFHLEWTDNILEATNYRWIPLPFTKSIIGKAQRTTPFVVRLKKVFRFSVKTFRIYDDDNNLLW